MAKLLQRIPNVLLTHPDIPQIAIDILKEKANVIICNESPVPPLKEILSKANGIDGLLWFSTERLTAKVLDAFCPQLKVISLQTAGYDNVDVAEIRKRGILLGHAPKVVDTAVADIAIGLAIAAARRFHEGRLSILNSEWKFTQKFMVGVDLNSATIGIVGFGNIGQAIAKRFRAFDVGDILYFGHREKPEGEKLGAKFVSFDELLHRSDFVILSAPLTNETRGFFNKEVFSKMKPRSVFVNISRGALVDQDALIDALKTNKIFAAGIDVMVPEPLPCDHELLTLPNLVITPHLGTATIEAEEKMSTIAAHNILRGLAGESLLAEVPFN